MVGVGLGVGDGGNNALVPRSQLLFQDSTAALVTIQLAGYQTGTSLDVDNALGADIPTANVYRRPLMCQVRQGNEF